MVSALKIQPANEPKIGRVSKVPELKIEPVNALIIQPGNALKMEVVDALKIRDGPSRKSGAG